MPVQMESYNAAKCEPVIYPQDARIDAARLAASQTLAKGTVLGKVTATGLLKPYASGNSDGTQSAVAILVYDVATDASGNHYLGGTAVGNSLNLPHRDTSVYVAGVFDTADLTGWDATAKSTIGARTLHNGYVRIP